MKKFFYIVGAALLALALTVGPSTAAKLITGKDIKDGSVTHNDLSPHVNGLLNKKAAKGATGAQGPAGAKGDAGPAGAQGPKGATGNDGTDGLLHAYYATAAYDVDDVNQGAIATVACSNVSDVAISGGVQTLGVGGDNSAVGNSFPGRMDWSTNSPKAHRLDGWIVQFESTVPSKNVTIWALCVPGADIPVVETYRKSS